MLTEPEFHAAADRLLKALAESIEDQLDDADVELADGVLTIENDGAHYVINKHGPNRQIWLASPVSGAWHFAPGDDGAWRSTRGGTEELLPMLASEFGITL